MADVTLGCAVTGAPPAEPPAGGADGVAPGAGATGTKGGGDGEPESATEGRRWQSVHCSRNLVTASLGRKAYVSVICNDISGAIFLCYLVLRGALLLLLVGGSVSLSLSHTTSRPLSHSAMYSLYIYFLPAAAAEKGRRTGATFIPK